MYVLFEKAVAVVGARYWIILDGGPHCCGSTATVSPGSSVTWRRVYLGIGLFDASAGCAV
jgi:hypothetical protein